MAANYFTHPPKLERIKETTLAFNSRPSNYPYRE
jgi:hypothetical protein